MSDSENAGRRSTPRVSLLGLLLITALVGTSISTWMLWREVGPLRAENRRLRSEVGELIVGRRDQVYAVRVPTRDSLTWKWRVWIPADVRYGVYVQVGQVVGHVLPEGQLPSLVLSGPAEHLIEYRVREQGDSGSWTDSLRVGAEGNGGQSHTWPMIGSAQGMEKVVGESTESFELGAPIELIVKQVVPATKVWNGMAPTDGFRVWIAPLE